MCGLFLIAFCGVGGSGVGVGIKNCKLLWKLSSSFILSVLLEMSGLILVSVVSERCLGVSNSKLCWIVNSEECGGSLWIGFS